MNGVTIKVFYSERYYDEEHQVKKLSYDHEIIECGPDDPQGYLTRFKEFVA